VNVADLLAAQAVERPDALAIVHGATSVTFRALDRAASVAAERLRGRGIGQGDTVLVVVPMSVSLYVTLAALLRLGAVAMFPDPSSGVSDVDACCRAHPPAGFIGIPKAHLLRVLSRAVRQIPARFSTRRLPGAVWLGGHGREASTLAPAPCTADSPALITFTSGSTGRPKAALRTHGFLLAQQRTLAETLDLTAGDVDLATLPMFVLANLAAGVTSIVPDADLRRPGAIDPGPVLEQIRRFRPNRAAASPAFFERLVAGVRADGRSLDSFCRIYTGGAPVFPGLLDRIAAVSPKARVTAVYGSTEVEPIAHIDREDIRDADRDAMIRGRGLLVGTVVDSLRLAILPDQWGTAQPSMTTADLTARRLPPGRPGEIVVSGEHVLGGYLDGIGDEDTKFRVDQHVWHRTGDAGYLDEQGRLWLLGRCAARVRDDRGDFYPFSIECAAVETLGVRRAAAIGWRGQRMLILEAHDDATRPEVSRLSESIGWAHLDAIRYVPRIPVDRRHNAKVDYPALLRLLETGG